ncbi:MAG: glycosyl transferase [Acidocella sp. 20-57-95]|nr:MAG: glycosyl transferase [Acidocella sp. 20-57-95]OYV58690.1 MAG: glycosyl transferase [Acidocella sp. 21-58-7]HQT64706.1 glycosyltransferase family 4 protein [Acidocella sp.]HQU05537.1 glycosyltransferase family 4 protein [Acidocella sp.]
MTEESRKILQVLPRLDTGGAERVVIEITEALTSLGHQTIIACEGGVLSPAAVRAGAKIVTLPLASKSPFTMRRNASLLAKLIRDEKIDLVHAHSRAPAWSALWATRRTKTPFVTSYHGTYNENAPFKRRYNAVMAAGDRVIAVSAFIGSLVRERHKVGDDRLRIIPGGVDANKFDPSLVQGDRMAKLARDWRLDVDAPLIMLAGRLTPWKGQRVLIAALPLMRHKDAVAVLVGSDQGRETYAQSLIAQAEALGVSSRLRMVGHTEDMPAALMLADIVVNASTDPEGFGRTVVEAQAMGRVVIATSHGGAGDTIRDGETGFLVPPGDPQQLAGALDKALDFSTEQRLAWGGYTRAVVAQNFSVQAMQYAVLHVYGELLD